LLRNPGVQGADYVDRESVPSAATDLISKTGKYKLVILQGDIALFSESGSV
jgi:hypothetical protein